MPPLSDTNDTWLDSLNNDLLSTEELPDRHVIRCALISGEATLLQGRKLTTVHPNAVSWLEQFASSNNMPLRTRQSRSHAPTELRRRRHSESRLALGINLLIHNAAPNLNVRLPEIGTSARSSFRSTHPRIPASSLVALSCTVKAQGRQFQIESNKFLQSPEATDNQIHLYACVITSKQVAKTFCYFESDSLRALAYPLDRDYVVDLIIGGGSGLSAIASLPVHRLDKERLHLSYFKQPGTDSYTGLLRASYSMVMSENTTGLIQPSYAHTGPDNDSLIEPATGNITA